MIRFSPEIAFLITIIKGSFCLKVIAGYGCDSRILKMYIHTPVQCFTDLNSSVCCLNLYMQVHLCSLDASVKKHVKWLLCDYKMKPCVIWQNVIYWTTSCVLHDISQVTLGSGLKYPLAASPAILRARSCSSPSVVHQNKTHSHIVDVHTQSSKSTTISCFLCN